MSGAEQDEKLRTRVREAVERQKAKEAAAEKKLHEVEDERDAFKRLVEHQERAIDLLASAAHTRDQRQDQVTLAMVDLSSALKLHISILLRWDRLPAREREIVEKMKRNLDELTDRLEDLQPGSTEQ